MTSFLTFAELLPITLFQSLIYAFVAIGIMTPFRLLNYSDLSSEGTFPLGGAVCALLMTYHIHPVLSLLAAVFAGAFAGLAFSKVHVRFKVEPLLCGVLAITMLFSINLRIMGKPNLAFSGLPTVFTLIGGQEDSMALPILLLLGVHACVFVILWLFLKTVYGYRLRCVGQNPTLAQAYGMSRGSYMVVGISLANALTALGGGIIAQSQGYSDVGMGFGILINGLASLMIGEFVCRPSSMGKQLLSPLIGSVLYSFVLSFVLAVGLPPSDLKLISGLTVLSILIVPSISRDSFLHKWAVGKGRA